MLAYVDYFLIYVTKPLISLPGKFQWDFRTNYMCISHRNAKYTQILIWVPLWKKHMCSTSIDPAFIRQKEHDFWFHSLWGSLLAKQVRVLWLNFHVVSLVILSFQLLHQKTLRGCIIYLHGHLKMVRVVSFEDFVHWLYIWYRHN